MAPRKKSRGANNSYPKVVFLSLSLDATDKKWLGENELGKQFPLSLVFDLAEHGYKVSFSPDWEHKRFICSLVSKREGDASNNHCISGSGASPEKSWYSLAYRHFIKLEESWKELLDAGDSDTSDFG